MDNRDREAIEELFGKIARVEGQSGPRDAEAEVYIRSRIAAQPSAPYYMAQTIVVQEQALSEAQRRIDELESRDAQTSSGGGLLGSIFGGGQGSRSRSPAGAGSVSPRQQRQDDGGPWGSRGGMGRGMGMGGGGFLAGAAQTAMGVAGGVVLGNMLADMLSPDEAAAAGLDDNAAAEDDIGLADADTDVADAGDFDVGDF